MGANGVSGAKDYPWYCGWLITCNDSGNDEVDAVTSAAPKANKAPVDKPAETKVASNKNGINPSFPLVACAANEADVDLCEGMSLNVSQKLLDPKTMPAEGATARWQLSIKSCNGDKVEGAAARCDFNGDGYDDETEFKAEEGKSTIIVEQHVGEETVDKIICQVNEGEGETIIYKPNAEPVKAEVINPSQCEYAGNKPSYGGILLDQSNLKNGSIIMVPQKVKVIIEGVKDCEGNTGEYLEVFVGSDEVLATNMGNGTYVAEYEVTDICSNPFTSRIVIEDNNKGTKAETVAYFSDISCSAAGVVTDTCDLPEVGSIQVDGLDPLDGTVVFGAPVKFGIEVKGCDSDNSDIESVKLIIGTKVYDMADENKDGVKDTVYEKSIPADIWAAPIRIVVTKKIGDKSVEVVRELWTVPTVITIPAQASSCEQTKNKPIVSGMIAEGDVDGYVYIGDPVTFSLIAMDCDGENSDLDVVLTIGTKDFPMSKPDKDGFTTVPVNAFLWGDKAVAHVYKNGEEVTSTTLYGLPAVLPKPKDPANVETPTASIIAPYSAKTNEPVVFVAGDPDEGQFDYSWEYGDGDTASGANPLPKLYSAVGDYTVKLTVSRIDDKDVKSSITHTISISDVAPTDQPKPIANLKVIGGYSHTIYEPVFFDASSSLALAPGASIESYTLNYGDGTEDAGQSSGEFNHIYFSTGGFTVVLTVTDTNKNTAQKTYDIGVYEPKPQ